MFADLGRTRVIAESAHQRGSGAAIRQGLSFQGRESVVSSASAVAKPGSASMRFVHAATLGDCARSKPARGAKWTMP